MAELFIVFKLLAVVAAALFIAAVVAGELGE